MKDTPETTTVSGVVSELRFSKTTFCAGVLTTGGRRLSFSVKGFVRHGEAVTLRGQYEEHPKYGRQFKGSEVVYSVPADEDGIAAWLANTVPGCGASKARTLTDLYGTETPRMLRDSPEQVAIEARLPIEFVRRAADCWHAAAERSNCCASLASHGLTQAEVEKLYARYKGGAVSLVESDPYLLLGDLPGFAWVRVDGIGRKLGVKPDHPGRVRAAVVEAVTKEVHEGSTCVGRDPALNVAADLVGAAVPKADLELALAEALQRRQLVNLGGQALALPGYAAAETYLWKRFATGRDANPLFREFTDEELDGMVRDRREVQYRGNKAELDDSQAAALLTAVRHRFSVITGGAGAGKSLLLKAIGDFVVAEGERRGFGGDDGFGDSDPLNDIDGFDDDEGGTWEDDEPTGGADIDLTPSVACAAPTGKAARRITELSGREASTIHRLLAYQPDTGRFLYGPTNPLPFDCLLIDEASMIDAGLLEDLFQAVGPDTCVVLIGDPNQLPPVGPGYPLRDILEHGLLPVARLEKCHRQAGPLKHNSVRVLEGVIEPTVLEGEPPPWVVHRSLQSDEQMLNAVKKLFEEMFPKWGYADLTSHQFMTARHNGPLGTDRLNELLQRLAQARLGVKLGERNPDEKLPLLVGDKVIHTKNNYTLNVMNGTVGVVVSDSPLCVEYDGRRVAYPKENAGEVILAYCLTPHRMQGSEIDCAAVICPNKHAFMQHRSWLYTACTRAKKTCVVFGDPDGVRRAAEKVETSRRRTVLELYAKYPEVRPCS